MKREIGLAATALLLALCLVGIPAAAEDSTASTNAKIAFTEGEVEIIDGGLGAGVNDMSIDFGANPLPAGATVYNAIDGAHTLRVQDARVSAGNWEVTVRMGPFVNQDDATNAFDGIITLANATTAITSQTQTGTFTVPETLSIDSQDTGAIAVATATTGYSHGTFDVTWAQEDIELSIDSQAAGLTQPDHEYQTIMVWTLGNV